MVGGVGGWGERLVHVVFWWVFCRGQSAFLQPTLNRGDIESSEFLFLISFLDLFSFFFSFLFFSSVFQFPRHFSIFFCFESVLYVFIFSLIYNVSSTHSTTIQ